MLAHENHPTPESERTLGKLTRFQRLQASSEEWPLQKPPLVMHPRRHRQLVTTGEMLRYRCEVGVGSIIRQKLRLSHQHARLSGWVAFLVKLVQEFTKQRVYTTKNQALPSNLLQGSGAEAF